MDLGGLNPELMKLAAQMYAAFFGTLYHALLEEGFTAEAAHQAALDLVRIHLEAFRSSPTAPDVATDQALKNLATMLTKGGTA